MSEEINKEIAEKVMGWWSVGIDTRDGTGTIWADGKNKRYGFNPSGSIAAAWLVVEKIRELKGKVEISSSFSSSPATWTVVICWSVQAKETYIHATVFDADVCIAICKAALEAVK